MGRNPWDDIGGIPEYLPLPVTDAHYRALGHIAAMWASVECQTQHLLWQVLRVEDRYGASLTAALRFDTVLDTLATVGAASDRLSAGQKQELASFSAQARQLQVIRNTIVHAAWVPGDDLANPLAYKIRAKDAASSGQPYSAPELETIALRINALLRAGLHLYLDLRFP